MLEIFWFYLLEDNKETLYFDWIKGKKQCFIKQFYVVFRQETLVSCKLSGEIELQYSTFTI